MLSRGSERKVGNFPPRSRRGRCLRRERDAGPVTRESNVGGNGKHPVVLKATAYRWAFARGNLGGRSNQGRRKRADPTGLLTACLKVGNFPPTCVRGKVRESQPRRESLRRNLRRQVINSLGLPLPTRGDNSQRAEGATAVEEPDGTHRTGPPGGSGSEGNCCWSFAGGRRGDGRRGARPL